MTNWVRTSNLEHVQRGVAGHFVQASRNVAALGRMARGDWLVTYSPRVTDQGELIQAFTAIGRVADDSPYPDAAAQDGEWRRRVDYLDGTAAPIRPLIGELSFIVDKRHWGVRFRLGLFRIGDDDLALIKSAMAP